MATAYWLPEPRRMALDELRKGLALDPLQAEAARLLKLDLDLAATDKGGDGG